MEWVAMFLVLLAVLWAWMFRGFTEQRRKLTRLANRLPGPIALPLIGNAYKLFGVSDSKLKIDIGLICPNTIKICK